NRARMLAYVESETAMRATVTFGGCNHRHTPFKMGEHGPEPDMTRMSPPEARAHPARRLDLATRTHRVLCMTFAWAAAGVLNETSPNHRIGRRLAENGANSRSHGRQRGANRASAAAALRNGRSARTGPGAPGRGRVRTGEGRRIAVELTPAEDSYRCRSRSRRAGRP